MNLKNLASQGRLVRYRTSREEIKNLLALAKRDIKDSQVKGLSTDRKFATAYNAVLQSATALLYCKGYRPKGTGHHFTVFEAMKIVLGKKHHKLADYFDSCRSKRNIADYVHTGNTSEKEAQELTREAEQFLNFVKDWIKKKYPQFER